MSTVPPADAHPPGDWWTRVGRRPTLMPVNRRLPLRGRDADLTVLSAALEDAARGSGAVVVIEGPAGIGKSRVVAEAAESASRLGMVVASGAADQLDELAPMAWFLATLRSSSPSLLPLNMFDGLGGRSD